MKNLNNPITCVIGGRHSGKGFMYSVCKELSEENEILKQKIKELELALDYADFDYNSRMGIKEENLKVMSYKQLLLLKAKEALKNA